MIRKFLIASMALSLTWTTIACSSAPSYYESSSSPQVQQPSQSIQNRLSDGKYPVQQVTYDDGTGAYAIALLNTAPGESSIYRTTNLPMARLTDEEIAAKEKSYLNVENGQPALHLTEDFKIEYIHNVTETQTNPQTGQTETVIVRQEPSFWTPFAGALAGQALGSLLFTPHYYFPPVYQPGGVLTGYGGYGRTYDQAVSRYQARYQAPPAEVRNRQTFRSTGQVRSPSSGKTSIGSQNNQRTRSTGSGYGSSNLNRSNRSNSQTGVRKSPGSFGSSPSRRVRVGGRRR